MPFIILLYTSNIRDAFQVVLIVHGCSSPCNNTNIKFCSILVLDAGAVAEFDSPDNLLNNKKGLFYSMAKDAGLV